jgi:hypothetical protein
MKPPKTNKTDFEKVTTDDFTMCTIEEITYDMEHTFKGFATKEDPKPVDKVKPAVRFKFKVEGYEYPHYSRWMSFNLGSKSTLFIKFVSPLVDGINEDADFDLENLKGMKVKVLWAEKNGFQYPETVRPQGKKVPMVKELDVEDDLHPDEELPEHIKNELGEGDPF